MIRPIFIVACGTFVFTANHNHRVLAEDDVGANGGKPTADQIQFFESRIRPVLIEQCLDCHSDDEPESDLSLESRATILKGGKFGPAIVPGKPKESLLISAINHDEFLKMPPKDKLSTAELVDLTRWVQTGAPWPNVGSQANDGDSTGKVGNTDDTESLFTDEHRAYWAFQPVVRHELPHVTDREWPQSPLDFFVLARLESAGLAPAPPAHRRALIRRATYDLAGLPPAEAEIEAFLNDQSSDAFAKVIDRLLASPQYGERWGRHWLDVARFADSNGLDENLSYANAFRYRDYVIAALNADKPYDRFVMEQIAGDLLEVPDGVVDDQGRFVATGFLAIGPKMLAEDDPDKMQMDIIDEQINTLGQAFMGLTLGCARCHDHKFDPIPTQDYYSLAGIFKSTKTMENHNVVAVWYERPLETERMQKANAEIDKQVANNERIAGLEKSRVKPAVAMGVTESTPRDIRVHLRGSHIALGEVAPRRLPRILAGTDQPELSSSQSGRLELARWLAGDDHPLTSRVMANRVWHWHFGRGIVASVDNFGVLGDRPTHPGLLDWLAARLVDADWSIKALHRSIMLSSTYQMSTHYDSRAASLDPENKLLWQMSRRRLTAEEIRDTVIHQGGGLDQKMGGSLLKVANRAYVTGSGSNLTDEFDNRRRSVYLPVVRSSVFDVLQTLDFPDPAVIAGRRQTSTIAPQALMMMNSRLVKQHSAHCAQRLMKRASTDRGRIGAAYRQLLGRPANSLEIRSAKAFLQRVRTLRRETGDDQEDAVWQSFCRALMSTSEFVYVE